MRNKIKITPSVCAVRSYVFMMMALVLCACAQADAPGSRHATIPSPAMAENRAEAVNEKPDSVIYLPLGSDVLVPEAVGGQRLPSEQVGPFELRSETVAGALQLVLSDYEIPLAFETEEGLTRTVTVANLKGPLDRVVNRICGLADLYCSFEDGLLVVKETQTFMVTVPPVGEDTEVLDSISTGIEAIIGGSPIVEEATRTLIYEATNRTSELAERYFQRIRASTALIVFEIYIWEVSLNSENSTGVDWQGIADFGNFSSGIDIAGNATTTSTPISIGLPTKGNVDFGAGDILEFLSTFGAVKTISQPQVTVLSGAEATLRAADTENYVSSISRSVDDGEVTVSTETDSVDTGFTIVIAGNWHNGTIYGNVAIELQEVRQIENFTFEGAEGEDSSSQVQLPQTTERELATQIRIRPGDSLLIGGLVRESDELGSSGPGFSEPLFPSSRNVSTNNRELVFLLKPRVIVYTSDEPENPTRNTSIIKTPKATPKAQSINKKERKNIEMPKSAIPLNLLNPAGGY